MTDNREPTGEDIENCCPEAKAGHECHCECEKELASERAKHEKEKEAYRQVAIRYAQDNKIKQENGQILVPAWVYLEVNVDAQAQRILNGGEK